jgi:hypothetical protein
MYLKSVALMERFVAQRHREGIKCNYGKFILWYLLFLLQHISQVDGQTYLISVLASTSAKSSTFLSLS